MPRRSKYVFVGIVVSVISGVMCMWTLSFTNNFMHILNSVLARVPSLVLIGLVVGIVADHFSIGVLPVVFGTSLGWIFGSVACAYLIATLNLDSDQASTQALFLGGQTVLGALFGLVPVYLAQLLKAADNRKTR